MAKKQQDDGAVATVDKKTKSKSNSDVDFSCPVCGGQHFHVEKGLVRWCLSCGASATPWAYQNDEYAKEAQAYASQNGVLVPGKTTHQDTPSCKAKRPKANGDLVECGSQNWQHDGKRLLYCRVCGANYTDKQPDKVDEIIDTLGPAAPRVQTPQSLVKKTREEMGRGSRLTKPGVSVEEYRARSNK